MRSAAEAAIAAAAAGSPIRQVGGRRGRAPGLWRPARGWARIGPHTRGDHPRGPGRLCVRQQSSPCVSCTARPGRPRRTSDGRRGMPGRPGQVRRRRLARRHAGGAGRARVLVCPGLERPRGRRRDRRV